ncbi:MAG: hypothetical protein D6831_03845, partial [Aquificota bacterium]
MSRIYKAASNWTGTIGTGGVADATTTTIPLSSATGLTNGEYYVMSIDRVDASGNKTPSKWEVVAGQLSGTNLVSCTRGVEGTAQAHSAGAVVEVLMTATHWNELKSYLEVEHNSDGTHSDITATTVTSTGQVAGSIIRLDEQSSTPSTPSSGKAIVYVKSDGYLYYKDDAGVERRYYPPIVDNDVAYQAKDGSGTARQVAKINASDVLEVGDSNLSRIAFNTVYTEGAKAYYSTTQNVVGGTTTTLSLDTEAWDTNGLYTPSNNYIEIQTAGKYFIDAQILWSTNSNGYR